MMDHGRAVQLALRITNSTTGWTDPATEVLVTEIASWRDIECAEAAVDAICKEWQMSSRPPLGFVVRIYNEARGMKRRQEESYAPSPPDNDDAVDPARGREVAYQAYRTSLGLPDDEQTRSHFAAAGGFGSMRVTWDIGDAIAD